MRVSDYVPNFYNKNEDMKAIIDSEENELETKLKLGIDQTFKNTFALTADEKGISQYENLLHIYLDENKDNLEYRRNLVLSKLDSPNLLTYNWLKNNLDKLLGVNNYQIQLDYNNYDLKIIVSNLYINTANLIYNKYRDLIPANLTFSVNVFETHSGNFKMAGLIHEGEYIKLKGDNVNG